MAALTVEVDLVDDSASFSVLNDVDVEICPFLMHFLLRICVP